MFKMSLSKQTFDGNGHVVSNLHIKGSRLLGLFGQLGSGAVISNLGLEAVDVNGTDSNIGSLVGSNKGSISTTYNTGEVVGNWSVGGLVGANYGGNITTSYSTGAVSLDVTWSHCPLTSSRGPIYG